MEVYFGTNFWDDRKAGAPLAKIPVHGAAEGDMLAWENKKVRIPAVYVGQEGAVLDLCICVPLPDISEYMEKWKDREYQDLSDEELEQAENFDLAVHDLIKKTLTEHQRIVFNGNGYSEAWVEEAARRELPNLKTMVDAIPSLVSEKTIRLFGRQHVLNEVELRARAEIHYELYSKAINIEAKTMVEMASRKYIPAVIRFTKGLADSINSVKSAVADADVSVQTELLVKTSKLLAEARAALKELQACIAEAAGKEEGKEAAEYFKDVVVPAMANLRAPIDELETLVDKEVWPVPTYGDLLFEV